jgi:ethanolamine utilization protein EutN
MTEYTTMLKGKVIGTATATMKHSSLVGWKMLVVLADGGVMIALDNLGAGVNDTVMISSDGKHTSEMIGTKATPARWSVVGIVDQLRVEN